jgi:hypothetical protein
MPGRERGEALVPAHPPVLISEPGQQFGRLLLLA